MAKSYTGKRLRSLRYFSPFEWLLLGGSVAIIAVFWLIFDRVGVWELVASLIGVVALMFCAKGNPIGQGLVILFGLLYGGISFGARYYGEMITYVGMTVPMAILSLISWLRHPYGEGHGQVRIDRPRRSLLFLGVLLTAAVTVAFYFILGAMGTAFLVPSTLSVTTSFAAVYLTFLRSPFFAVAYACNDLLLILLWSAVVPGDPSAVSVVVCFSLFFVNDIYGFVNWLRLERQQKGDGEG